MSWLFVDQNRILWHVYKMKVDDRVRDFNTRNYFIFGIFVGIGFPSMPKREIDDMILFGS